MPETFPLQRERDDCGRLIFHPECFDAPCNDFDQDVGLGPGVKRVIQVTIFPGGAPIDANPELWIFVHGFEGQKLGVIPVDGTKLEFTINWEFRRSIEAGSTVLGIWFPSIARWQFSSKDGRGIEYEDTHIEITIDQPAPPGMNVPPEMDEVTEGVFNCDCGDIGAKYAILVYDCTCEDCTRPYDNTVFCLDCYDETAISIQHLNSPGLAKQVFTMEQQVIRPLRGVALTRSADAFNENLQLLYQNQKWVMVWDLELNRLVDFFPQEWLRFGAAMYFQNTSLRKEINVCSNRKPYYIEVVDLGLVNHPQGSFDMDKDGWGQRTSNWDVPSRLVALSYGKQQQPAFGHGTPSGGITEQGLHAEFNQVSLDRFHGIADEAVTAQRQRFFEDRNMFLDQTARQRFHDQIMFLTREVSERVLRLMTDGVENLKLIVDSFNPDAQGSFGYFLVVLLNGLSNKFLRSKNDFKSGNFEGTTLGEDEESIGDWLRYIYGELRRVVEIAKIEKKDIQLGLLKTLSEADLVANPNAAIEALAKLDLSAIEEQFELASSGKIPAGGGLVDPDTKEENLDRGI